MQISAHITIKSSTAVSAKYSHFTTNVQMSTIIHKYGGADCTLGNTLDQCTHLHSCKVL